MKISYKTKLGKAYQISIEDFVRTPQYKRYLSSVDLILTSPPYPLTSPKAYGNKVGEDYRNWITDVVASILPLLKPSGSLIMEIGNAWDKGQPTMSTLPLETLLDVKNKCDLQVCQQFIWNNPNKLPSPAPWVNVGKIRVKDSYTHLWWFSKSAHPKSDVKRVLQPYSSSMKNLLLRQGYNLGERPSGHNVGKGFLKDNGGSIPSNVISIGNSFEDPKYREWCKSNSVPQHPARMPISLAQFFINLTTEIGDLVLDPFAGSNTTGKAAEELGRNWVSIEKDRQYVIGSEGRFK